MRYCTQQALDGFADWSFKMYAPPQAGKIGWEEFMGLGYL